jgi:hypothetical protein
MQPAQSAIVQGGSADVSVVKALPNPTTPGNAILAVVAAFHNGPRSVTDSFDNAYTLVGTQLFGTAALELWAADNIAGGINHRVTLAAAANAYPSLCPIELTGENLSALIDSFVSQAGTSSTPASPLCPSAPGEILLTALSHTFNGSPGIVPGAAFAALQIASDAASMQPLAVAWVQSDAPLAGAWSVSESVPYACFTVSLKPAAGPPPAQQTFNVMDVHQFTGGCRTAPAPLFPLLCDVTAVTDIALGSVNPFTAQLMVQSAANGPYEYVGSPVSWSIGPAPSPAWTGRGLNALVEFTAPKPVSLGASLVIAPH